MTRPAVLRVLGPAMPGLPFDMQPVPGHLLYLILTAMQAAGAPASSVECIYTVSHSGRHLGYSFLSHPYGIQKSRQELAYYNVVFDRLYFWDRWYGRSMVTEGVQVDTVQFGDATIPVLQVDR